MPSIFFYYSLDVSSGLELHTLDTSGGIQVSETLPNHPHDTVYFIDNFWDMVTEHMHACYQIWLSIFQIGITFNSAMLSKE